MVWSNALHTSQNTLLFSVLKSSELPSGRQRFAAMSGTGTTLCAVAVYVPGFIAAPSAKTEKDTKLDFRNLIAW